MRGAIFMIRKLFLVLGVVLCAGCNSSAVSDLVGLIDDPPRKTIDTSRLGTNAFANDARFGSPASQLAEVRDTLQLGFVRMLFAWSDSVQPAPGAAPNFGFYDQLAAAIPAGIDAIVVLTGVPSWMSNSANWSSGDPRATFVDLWVRRVASRYASNGRIIGWQIWNEPNTPGNPDNVVLDVADNPGNYVELLARAFSTVKDISPGKRVINAATTAINQNFPESLDYNRAMRDVGARDFTDVWAVHYYGKQYENVVRDGGVRDFLNGLGKAIWLTESGEQGVNQQLEYGERTWPFLIDKIPGIERIYQYQFTEATAAESTYGLRNLTPGALVSDLYVYLKDRRLRAQDNLTRKRAFVSVDGS